MRRLLRVVPLLFTLAIWVCNAAVEKYYLRVYPQDIRQAMFEFSSCLQIDCVGVNLRQGFVDIIVDIDEYPLIDLRYRNEIRTDLYGPGRTPDPEYKDPDEIEAILLQYHMEHPDITDLISIGQVFREQGYLRAENIG